MRPRRPGASATRGDPPSPAAGGRQASAVQDPPDRLADATLPAGGDASAPSGDAAVDVDGVTAQGRTGVDRGFWADKRVLVTGASGIVGSWLAIALAEAGAAVHCLIRDVTPLSYLHQSGWAGRVVQIHGALEDYRVLERTMSEHEIDSVFHLGAQTIVGTALRSPLATLRSNVAGTWNLLEAVRVHAPQIRRVVVASSDKAYGDHGGVPYTEGMALVGRHPYDVSKSCADLVAQAYAHTYGLPVAIARCANVFGGGDLNFNRLVPGTIRAALRGSPPVLRSDGTYVREYLYVEDVVRAYCALAEAADAPGACGSAFNFGSGRPLTVLALVAAILQAVGRTDLRPTLTRTATAEIPAQTLNWERARRVLGWEPRYSLEQGLAQTVRWYAAYFGRRP